MNCRTLALSKIAGLKDVNILQMLDTAKSPSRSDGTTYPPSSSTLNLLSHQTRYCNSERKGRVFANLRASVDFLGISHLSFRKPGGFSSPSEAPGEELHPFRESQGGGKGLQHTEFERVARSYSGRLKVFLRTQWNRRMSSSLCPGELQELVQASLVTQWLRICLPMQGTRVRALVWEDPTCRGATRSVSHNY